MSNDASSNTVAEKHAELAELFGRELDPLMQFEAKFESISIDPFELYIEEQIQSRDYADRYVENLLRVIDQWQEFMEAQGRHPACPATDHARDFATKYKEEEGNQGRTVREKLTVLSRVYKYFQSEPSLPHPTDFNPFESAKHKIDLTDEGPKDPRPISLEEVREEVGAITHIRDRTIISSGFKLGIRAGELSNIKIPEVHIVNREVQRHYPNLGTHRAVVDRPNALYIPHDRKGNKRQRPTVLPIDDELREMLIRYLLCRPDTGEPWLFLSKRQARKLDYKNINEDVWKKYFRPEYGPTEQYRGISSHYGRHWFTTWWRIQRAATRPLIKYMRGDIQSGGEKHHSRETIDSYIHVYYEDIEPLYRRNIFKFEL